MHKIRYQVLEGLKDKSLSLGTSDFASVCAPNNELNKMAKGISLSWQLCRWEKNPKTPG